MFSDLWTSLFFDFVLRSLPRMTAMTEPRTCMPCWALLRARASPTDKQCIPSRALICCVEGDPGRFCRREIQANPAGGASASCCGASAHSFGALFARQAFRESRSVRGVKSSPRTSGAGALQQRVPLFARRLHTYSEDRAPKFAKYSDKLC